MQRSPTDPAWLAPSAVRLVSVIEVHDQTGFSIGDLRWQIRLGKLVVHLVGGSVRLSEAGLAMFQRARGVSR